MCSCPKSMTTVLPDPVAQRAPCPTPGALQALRRVPQRRARRLRAAELLQLSGQLVELPGADGQAAALQAMGALGDLDVVLALGGQHDALDDRRRRVDKG